VSIKPEISWRNPSYAGRLKDYNQWTSRCEMILQHSRHVARVGILYPIADLQSRYNFSDYKVTNGKEAIRGNDYFNFIGLMSKKLRVDYTLLHPEVLDGRCIIKKSGILRLDNARNHEEYSLLIVPWSRTMHASNLRKIKEFVKSGGKVLFTGNYPEQSAEPSKNGEVKNLAGELRKSPNVHFIEKPDAVNMKEFFNAHLDPIVSIGEVKVIKEAPQDHQDWPASFRDTDYAYNCIHKVKEGMDFFLFSNPTDCHLTAEIGFNIDANRKIELWNPHTGGIENLPSRKHAGKTWITLPLDPLNSRFIVFN
jgi:hypothetical protein